MHLTMKNGHIMVLVKLVEHFDCTYGFKDPDAVDYAGNTPLHSLMQNIDLESQDFEFIIWLLKNAEPGEFKSLMELRGHSDCSYFELLDNPRHENNRKLFYANIKNKSGQTPYDLLMNRYEQRNPFDSNLKEIVSIMEKIEPKKKKREPQRFKELDKRRNSRGKG